MPQVEVYMPTGVLAGSTDHVPLGHDSPDLVAPLALEVGPYRVTGDFATHPGFDPSKSIARPSGTFVPLRDATIELVQGTGPATAERPYVHVNRYTVDEVSSYMMLGHFFPGARLITPETAPVA